MTRAELLSQLRTGWNDLHTDLASLSREQRTERTDAAGWTVKDHVLHLAIWERGIVALLNRQNRREAMGLDAAIWDSHDVDAINGVIRDKHAGMSWPNVVRWFNEIHVELLSTLERLTDDDINSPYRTFAPDSENTQPVLEYIIGNTYAHYEEHLPWIRAIVTHQGDAEADTPRTTADLLARIDAGWKTFQTYLATLEPVQMTGPTDAAGWTAKDHYAHISQWERGVSEALAGGNRREVMRVDDATWNTRDFDLINAVLRQQVAGLPLDEVHRIAQAVHTTFVERIARLSDDDLTRPYSEFEPGSTSQTPIIAYLMGDTYAHYAEHLPWIEAIVTKP